MPTFNYTFDELYGAGTSSIDLTAGANYTFNITNNSGSSYFVMETVSNQNGVYGDSSPKNLSGSFTSITNIATAITSSNYISGFALPQGTNSFIFTPTFNITGSTLRLRGTGGITLGITGGSLADTFITNAGITDPTEISAINTLVSDLDTANLLTEFYAAYPHVGGTSTSNMYNLVNPEDSDAAFRLSFNGGWTFASNGATPNGVNAYANTHLDPSLVLNETDLAAWGYYSKTGTAISNEYVMGVTDGVNGGIQLIARRDGNFSYALSDFSTVSYRGANSSNLRNGVGFFIGTQQGLNAKLFVNGLEKGVNTYENVPVKNISTGDVYLGAINLVGDASNFTGKRCVFSFISKKLTDAQVLSLDNIVQTFQTNLGR
jgi:hypothetical protein